MSKSYSKTRILVECALMIAIGTVLSNIKFFTMPNGGSITLLSMLPFVLVSFRHGAKWGLFTGFVNACLQMIMGFYPPPASTFLYFLGEVLLDYVLAFMALAPVCMIAPISSWAAAVSSTAEDLDTGISGIQLFIRAIPYNFYSLLTFVFIITLTLLKFDYGPMRGFEERARNTGDLSGSAGSTEENANPKGRVIDLVIPVIMLIILCTIGMLYVGGFFGADTSGCTDYAGDFIGAFGNTDAFVGLPWGGIIALVLTVIYLVARRAVGFREAMGCIPKGFQAMISPIIILTLAVSLKTTLNALGAADYVHDLMYAASEGLYNMLPAVIFLVACVLAFASGTSWGTFGILIPIVTAIFPSDSALLYIGISACCAGAVCGDHCSPISDTTIMSSAGAQVEHVNHVATQLPYAITVACLSFVCFVLAGFIQNWVVCLAIGVVLTVGTLFAIRNVEAQKARIKD